MPALTELLGYPTKARSREGQLREGLLYYKIGTVKHTLLL
jgi:hypothetical protein